MGLRLRLFQFSALLFAFLSKRHLNGLFNSNFILFTLSTVNIVWLFDHQTVCDLCLSLFFMLNFCEIIKIEQLICKSLLVLYNIIKFKYEICIIFLSACYEIFRIIALLLLTHYNFDFNAINCICNFYPKSQINKKNSIFALLIGLKFSYKEWI